ncbi:SMP-30/gluconolactonase/LRE family protein [Nakamurella flavida]|uniref:SMP-30/gluconolactonase/LRE family protein n=1 Tax=Nakamurella flavida TaxID=363630 RepID=A0A938YCX6_9ACTN|nr:SMP-30/gluconolactonase/LRE family protein [Nakamurella flavida]MBM9475355.1 SMP-30/gluconolactonase/LRE family protein [Nakamurella flavida]MDP9776933.1 sugar lactone lactonase YvrE [Nakamurella flavida]
MQVEQITDPVAYHGEGPAWSPTWGGLRWVDMLAGDILTLGDDGTVHRRQVGTVAAVIRPRTAGGAIIAVERGFALEDDEGHLTALPEVFGDPTIRMNEGGCDPDGRFYCGTMAYDQRPGAAQLYRLDPDGSIRTVLTDLTISNGLEWSPDGSLAYFDDTPTGRVALFDYETAAGLTNRRTFVEIDPDDGHPDGLTVDSEGGVWVALFGGGAVRRYLPDGTLDAVLEVPARQVTACTFGGPDLDQLFITTSRENLEPDDDPLAGSLFRASVGVRGLPLRPFAG